MINLGDEVQDVVTGFEGVAIQRLECLFGPTEIAVQQRILNDDKRPMEKIWFAESQLELKKKPLAFGKDFGNDECSITAEDLAG